MLARPPYPMAALLHVKRHLIQKKLYNEGVVNIPILKLRKLVNQGTEKLPPVVCLTRSVATKQKGEAVWL